MSRLFDGCMVLPLLHEADGGLVGQMRYYLSYKLILIQTMVATFHWPLDQCSWVASSGILPR
jgi:hypothetical protein